MRILVHDYAGHPFQIQLSRALAQRGHEVVHAYCASTVTPRGSLSATEREEGRLAVESLDLGEMICKEALFRRRAQESRYGRLLCELVERVAPEVVISGNTPSHPQLQAALECSRRQIPFICWVQDIYGVAAKKLLRKKLGLLGSVAGNYLVRLDKRALHASAGAVVITDDFASVLRDWGIADHKIHTVENWAPLEECPLRPKDNHWSRRHGLVGKRVLLYSGTLGMKHNPGLLLRLAEAFRHQSDVRVVVISSGAAVEWLREKKTQNHVDNLILLDFQPFEVLPDVLASADVLLAVLEPDAGTFSVPSKVLTYMCSGRPLLLSVPLENLAARIVQQQASGLAVSPEAEDGFLDAARELIEDSELRDELGGNGRAYAEATFDIDAITDRFEEIFAAAGARPSPKRAATLALRT